MKRPCTPGSARPGTVRVGGDQGEVERGHPPVDQLPEPKWVPLLDQRRAGHSADVIEPYRELVEAYVLDSRDKERYRRDITLLRQLRDAHIAWRFRRLRGVPSRSASTP